MKPLSSRIASKVGKLTLGLGLTAAMLSPFAGAGIAAWSTGAAALASMGLGAAVPLAGAGLVGGFVLGTIAAPVIAIGAVAAAGIAYGVTRSVGSFFEWLVTPKQREEQPAPAQTDVSRSMDFTASNVLSQKLSPSFAQALEEKVANENRPQPQYKHAPRIGL